MGTNMGSSYANLFVGYIEHLIFQQYTGPKPVGATSCSCIDLR